MKLTAYLQERKLSVEAFAELVECDPTTIWRAATGRSIPRRALLLRIMEVTGGKVTANDFIEVSSEREEAA